MRRKLWATCIASFVGPCATFAIIIISQVAMDPLSVFTFTPGELVEIFVIGLIVGLYASVIVVPGAAVLACLTTVLRIERPSHYIVAGAIFGPAYVIGGSVLMSSYGGMATRPVVDVTALEDISFLVATALSGALSGALYWHLAIRSRPTGPARTREPPIS